MNKTLRQDNELMKLLNVGEISRFICNTNMGMLTLRLRKGETDYQFVLDAVELPKELNKEVMDLLYAPQETINPFEPLESLPKHSLEKIVIKPKAKKK